MLLNVSQCIKLAPKTFRGLLWTSRSFVSPAFKCETEWNKRLDSKIFQKIDISKLFFEIERKMQAEKRASAVDIDIFANSDLSLSGLDFENYQQQLEELLNQFRRTPQTYQMLPSTTHAVVRKYLDYDQTDSLMRMVDDRLNYGLFPDNYSLVLMLDCFLEKENWRDAAKVAVHMMIQEDVKIPVAQEMGLLGAYKYTLLRSPEPWEPQGTPPEPEPEDDINIRLDYLPSGYFDDHLDLTKVEHLLGKTLAQFSMKTQGDPVVCGSLEILGWSLFEKWDKLETRLSEMTEVVEEISEKLNEILQSSEKEDLAKTLETKKKKQVNVESELKAKIMDSLNAHETAYIEQIVKDFESWNGKREMEIEHQFRMYQNEARKQAVLAKRKEMNSKEEDLFFFDRKVEFERRKEEKLLKWIRKLPPRTWSKRITLKPLEKVSKDYVPPEVGRRRK